MPYDHFARTLASCDVPLPSSGAPRYTLPESECCPICFLGMGAGPFCARCEPLDDLTAEQAQAMHKGAVVSLPNIHMKAHG